LERQCCRGNVAALLTSEWDVYKDQGCALGFAVSAFQADLAHRFR
jgi:hypothetical protein